MERYIGTIFTRTCTTKRPRSESSTIESSQEKQNECTTLSQNIPAVDGNTFVADPGKRLPISSVANNATEREAIRKTYLINGPCQPNLDNFPPTVVGNKMRRFSSKWYTEFGSWLEYSESKDAAFCLYCYLFSCEHGNGRAGHDAFVGRGFRNWKDKEKIYKHVGEVGSIHNKCYNAAEDLINRSQLIIFARPINTKRPRSEPSENIPKIDTDTFVADPGKRLPISSIAKNAKEREDIRRTYLINGPCQPHLDDFPQTLMGARMRRFNSKWYNEFGSWLEYSESKDAAFCLYCYLFSCEHGNGRDCHDAFVGRGFRNWKKKEKFDTHVGKGGSIHDLCYNAAKDLMNRKQHIDIIMSDVSERITEGRLPETPLS